VQVPRRKPYGDAACRSAQLDWIIATSETHHDYPSLSAHSIHGCSSAKIAARRCRRAPASGLLNALCRRAVAPCIGTSADYCRRNRLMSQPHARAGPCRGEFGGLFGDGASAFLLRRAVAGQSDGFRLGDFYLAAQATTLLRSRSRVPMRDASTCNLLAKLFLAPGPPSRVWKKFSPPWSCAVEFRERRWEDLPLTSRIHASLHSRKTVRCFSRNCFLPSRKLPANLGSSMCGAALHACCRPPRDNRAANASDLPRVSRARPPLCGGWHHSLRWTCQPTT